MGLKALGFMPFGIYNISMKRFLITALLIISLPGALLATTLNVLILKRAPRADISFAQNYAVVVDEETFLGPISKNNKLLVEVSGSALRFTAHDPKTKSKKVLGTFKGKVDVVRSLGAVNFKNTPKLATLKKKPLPAGSLNLSKNAQSSSPFATLRQAAYGGDITYSGPLTIYPKRGLNIVETVPLESYVTQVVNCELGGEKSLEALKAQSVMVRTFALFMVQTRLNALKKGNTNWLHFQLFATPVDQAYNCRKRANNRELPSALVQKAVKETADQVVLKNGKLARVQYNTCAKKAAPKGVICQEKMISLARKSKSYKEVLAHFLPGTTVSSYDARHLSTETARRLKDALHTSKK